MECKYLVTKCICYDTTFEEMKRIMKERKIKTLDELKDVKIVADNCRLCVPYINKMIETGETKFHVLLES
ncbi:MAG: hypothetical protein IPL53_15185 [Ignavibacteria bacterium]|nr:hypothetical protein [Ignavibacteria bacterium]